MYQSRWTTAPMIHILPHWDWTDGNKKVWLYKKKRIRELRRILLIVLEEYYLA